MAVVYLISISVFSCTLWNWLINWYRYRNYGKKLYLHRLITGMIFSRLLASVVSWYTATTLPDTGNDELVNVSSGLAIFWLIIRLLNETIFYIVLLFIAVKYSILIGFFIHSTSVKYTLFLTCRYSEFHLLFNDLF